MGNTSKLLVVLAAVAVPGLASAAEYGMAGCGLGSIVFKDKPGIVQVLAATTNGSFYSQTLGITSGTSNCTAGGTVKAAAEQQAFLEVNMPQLSRDAAAGQGEYLAAFSTLLGCDASSQSAFFSAAQANHEKVFSAEKPSEVLSGLKSVVASDPALARSCSRI